MPRFGKDKDARNEELDRQAAEEVERLTRRGGPPGMGGGMPGMGGGASEIMSSPLDRIAAELADAPRPSQRRPQAPRRTAAQPAQAFTPLPSGEVGSSFGPGGLNPGPRGSGGGAPPPPAFGGGADYGGGPVTGPPVYHAGEPDEEEEMSITELALMDHAAHTGHSPEDLVMQYDASTAEEMRDEAMRKFYERQQARRPGAATSNPFAPAGMRGPSGPAPVRRSEDPAAAGGALAQRLANRRRREEEEARRARAEAEPASPTSAAPAAPAAPATRVREAAVDDGALARVLARRRQALSLQEPAPEHEPAPVPEPEAVPGRRHATSRAASSPSLRAVPTAPDEDDVAGVGGTAASRAVGRSTRPAKKAAAPAEAPAAKRAAKAPVAKATRAPAVKAPATKPPATRAPATRGRTGGARLAEPATKAPVAKVAKAPGAKTSKASAVKAPATKGRGARLAEPAAKAPAAAKAKGRATGKARTVFCIECGEKNPAIAKFCFSCGTRLAASES